MPSNLRLYMPKKQILSQNTNYEGIISSVSLNKNTNPVESDFSKRLNIAESI